MAPERLGADTTLTSSDWIWHTISSSHWTRHILTYTLLTVLSGLFLSIRQGPLNPLIGTHPARTGRWPLPASSWITRQAWTLEPSYYHSSATPIFSGATLTLWVGWPLKRFVSCCFNTWILVWQLVMKSLRPLYFFESHLWQRPTAPLP